MKKLVVTTLLLLILISPLPIAAAQTTPHEYQIKGAFLYNFTKFVTFPDSSFASADSPFELCVFGDNVFGPLLGALSQRKVGERSVDPRVVDNIKQALSCHLLYVPDTEKMHFPEILERTKGKPILLVAEGALKGTITFRNANDSVRFEIDRVRAIESGLKISSHLMKLAFE